MTSKYSDKRIDKFRCVNPKRCFGYRDNDIFYVLRMGRDQNISDNSIIPILIDSEENAFDDEKIDLIIQKLDTELLDMKLKLRKWYQENGKENILRWLNEELEEK